MGPRVGMVDGMHEGALSRRTNIAILYTLQLYRVAHQEALGAALNNRQPLRRSDECTGTASNLLWKTSCTMLTHLGSLNRCTSPTLEPQLCDT